MHDIKIVEYDPSYAAAIADMWNKSGENWGGEETVQTAEDVIANNEVSGDICVYLALDGDEVVGYCSFSQYKQDEGASYIPLLNVRPDCIGKKIGKKLVLTCVNRAMGEEWPRLDLYTWQGNDKAVPLYKKCGFFWEKRDDSTHLMNFIPYVMRTEAVSEFFDVIDWYADNKREIIVESDGRIEGDFDYFDYKWEKDDLTLNMEFERRGRGLTSIETDEYLIRARVDGQDLVTGMDYTINYEVVNKSGKPLHVAIQGENDKNISFDYTYSGDVVDRQEIQGTFHIDDIEEAQDKWKTHPGVVARIAINGKEALFKVGVNPKLPVKMKVGDINKVRSLGENTCYIDLENGFDRKVTVTGQLKSTDIIMFNEPDFTCTMDAKGKVSIPVSCELLDYGFYNELIPLTIQVGDKQINYQAKLRGPFRGLVGRFSGEDEEHYYIYNGSYNVCYMKKSNTAVLMPASGIREEVLPINPPAFGKPYYKELSNKKPEYVELISGERCEIIKAHFALDKMPGIECDFCVELYEEGLAKTYIEVINVSDTTYKDFCVSQEFFQLWYNAHIPYNHQIMSIHNADGLLPLKWDKDKLTESWVYSQYDRKSRCLGWSSDMKVNVNHVWVNLETEVKGLEAGGGYVTKPITCASGTFASWKEFRRYMGYQEPIHAMRQDFESSLKNYNPFIKGNELELTIQEHKKVPVEGSFIVTSRASGFQMVDEKLTFENNVGTKSIAYDKIPEMDILDMKIDTGNKLINRKKAVFFQGAEDVITKRYTESDMDIYEVSNGLITLKSAPAYMAGIYSMTYKGDEWLDSSFPTPMIKGWWNYWTGGITTLPAEFSFASAHEEDKLAEFVTLEDSKGNIWSGIKTTMDIKKQKELEGVKVEDYFLLLSGVPVICNFTVVSQETGEYMCGMKYQRAAFIREGEQLKDNWLLIDNRGEEEVYRCLDGEFDIYVNNYLIHGSVNKDYHIVRLLEKESKHESYNTNGVNLTEDEFDISMPHGSKRVIGPAFTIFTKEKMNDVMLEDLYEIRFKVL